MDSLGRPPFNSEKAFKTGESDKSSESDKSRKKYRAPRKGKTESSVSEQRISKISEETVKATVPPQSPFLNTSSPPNTSRKRKLSPKDQTGVAPKRSATALGAITNALARKSLEYIAFAFGGLPGLAAAKVGQIAYDLHQHNFEQVEGNAKRLLEAVVINQFSIQGYVALKVTEATSAIFEQNWKRLVGTLTSVVMMDKIVKESLGEERLQEVYKLIKENESVQSVLLYLFSISPEILNNFVKNFMDKRKELEDITGILTQRVQTLYRNSTTS